MANRIPCSLDGLDADRNYVVNRVKDPSTDFQNLDHAYSCLPVAREIW